MQTYCLGCKKNTGNIGSKKVMMVNKVTRDKSRCANCIWWIRFWKQRFNKETSENNINHEIFIY